MSNWDMQPGQRLLMDGETFVVVSVGNGQIDVVPVTSLGEPSSQASLEANSSAVMEPTAGSSSSTAQDSSSQASHNLNCSLTREELQPSTSKKRQVIRILKFAKTTKSCNFVIIL